MKTAPRFWNERSRFGLRATTIFAMLVVICAPFAARAGDPVDDEAEAHVRRGIALRKEYEDLAALEEFQRAYAIAPSAHARAQIALAEQALGHWVAAESDLEAALRASDGDPWIAKNRDAIERALGFVTTHLGLLVVECNVQGAEVLVNGVRVGTTPLTQPIRVVIGTALVRVRADGYAPIERIVPIAPGDQARELLTLVPSVVTARSVASSDARVEEGSPARLKESAASVHGTSLTPATAPSLWPAVALTTAGVAGLAIGGGYGIDALVAKTSRNDHCTASTCDATGERLDQRARRDALVSTVAIGAGIAAVAVGGWFFWRSNRAARSAMAFTPSFDARGASMALTGAF